MSEQMIPFQFNCIHDVNGGESPLDFVRETGKAELMALQHETFVISALVGVHLRRIQEYLESYAWTH